MASPLFDVSEVYGDSCYMTVYGDCFEDIHKDKRIELKHYWGKDFLQTDEGDDIPIKRLILQYCFPLTAPPNDPCWKCRTYNNKAESIKQLKWDELLPTDPLKYKNGSAYRSDSKSKHKYISLEGKYYRLRIKKINYSGKFAKLEDAVKKRDTLLL